ncbi:hypothetical protein P4J09_25660 [Bacillus cereus]|uniref:hypothetical protein n=1 Tax=Bacillus cereus group TaxID=86661 RepID=UPI000B4ADE01|nr:MULTISPECIES: hypothetical protein [Bacillus cereus group]HDR7969504.1 hypothetical protein [Bacillus pacificus]MDA2681084.1 hypothetical protein [Bacillus cereus group sp. Bc029]MDA2742081.1 hypothetical protein [Bacillus cereus group sp. Bc011]MEB9381395.1 hypothetical protein [Bacillus cereus]PFF91226.1 hypothetical protein CN329_12535 [Bacillus cereus]
MNEQQELDILREVASEYKVVKKVILRACDRYINNEKANKESKELASFIKDCMTETIYDSPSE